MSFNSGSGSSSGRRSFLGSIKNLGRSSSKEGKQAEASSSTMGSNASTARSSNLFSSLTSPTRRPPVEVPPPSYGEATSGPSTLPQGARGSSPRPPPLSIGSHAITTDDDPYAFLSTFDTVFLIDDSSSMNGNSWDEVRDVLKKIAPVCATHDADGIDVYFLNYRNQGRNASPAGGFLHIRNAKDVTDLFTTARPRGLTPTGTRLQAILGPYVRHFEAALKAAGGDADATGVRPLNVIVITDGQPTDDPEAVLLSIARRLDKIDAPPYQLGVQFFQVGDDPRAREALIDLDDNLGKKAGQDVRDMVDTTTWDGKGPNKALDADGILKAVLGAVVKRLDRRNAGGRVRA